ncbi:MAG: NAD(P)-dependent glycerol-3-phosphate dehydrogenase [Gallionellaceae bacterium]|jgi:glycerol-3-phosphate dehydrogenase (NAD(P)+)|nr:NAD(P)-dependent glycerol-3-phosphate dehydrogenase [Gallionellaceae bacterium]
MNIAILGAGAWGTALAASLAARHRVTLWARDAAQADAMRATRRNERYLPEILLPETLNVVADLDAALDGVELILVVVPVSALRVTLENIARRAVPVVWACKGFEAGSAQLPDQVAAEVLSPYVPRGVLSGPSFALEVARGLPTALTLASTDGDFAGMAAQALHHARLRVYSSTDVTGVETGGAVKNVLAIAAGISDGMGFGYNARAAMITRGLAEMTRLGLRMGGRAETLGGLSGAGDLILTCTGDLSRNRQVGLLLAQKNALPDILRQLGHVAEGVYTVREVHRLAQMLDVDMPICAAVYRVLYENVPAASAVEALLSRQPNSEFR